jgi:hypothetical protein
MSPSTVSHIHWSAPCSQIASIHNFSEFHPPPPLIKQKVKYFCIYRTRHIYRAKSKVQIIIVPIKHTTTKVRLFISVTGRLQEEKVQHWWTSALDGDKGPTSCPSYFTPREEPPTHQTGGWVCPTACLYIFFWAGGISCPTRIWTSYHPPCTPGTWM